MGIKKNINFLKRLVISELSINSSAICGERGGAPHPLHMELSGDQTFLLHGVR